MSPGALSRRSFLKLGAAAFGGCFSSPILSDLKSSSVGIGRVAVTAIYRYSEPNYRSQRTGILHRDELISILNVVEAPDGPVHNPRWYQLAEGFVHSGTIQRVEGMRLNLPPMQSVPEGGQLGEVTVPYTRVYRQSGTQWTPLYRLYYQSTHWISGVGSGPRPGAWYRLTNDLLHVHYFAPAAHIRPIAPEEISPLSPEVPPEDKRIEVHLDAQTLFAYEGGQQVMAVKISSGVPTKDPLPGELPTDTPTGRFYVQTKMPSRHMGDGRLTSDIEAYELAGVPWVCIFQKDGIALHGTYWHDNFGRRMSHGCVNLPNAEARWLYRWTTPQIAASDWYVRGLGTVIDIQ